MCGDFGVEVTGADPVQAPGDDRLDLAHEAAALAVDGLPHGRGGALWWKEDESPGLGVFPDSFEQNGERLGEHSLRLVGKRWLWQRGGERR